MKDHPLGTPQQVAEYLHIPVKTLAEWAHMGPDWTASRDRACHPRHEHSPRQSFRSFFLRVCAGQDATSITRYHSVSRSVTGGHDQW
jgi:hypothetical protein